MSLRIQSNSINQTGITKNIIQGDMILLEDDVPLYKFKNIILEEIYTYSDFCYINRSVGYKRNEARFTFDNMSEIGHNNILNGTTEFEEKVNEIIGGI